jgi:hypothetical protein
MRETWTDERLDDLSRRMDAGFAHVDAGFARVDADIRALGQSTNERFDALQRTMLQVGGGLIGVMIVGTLSLVGVIATRL